MESPNPRSPNRRTSDSRETKGFDLAIVKVWAVSIGVLMTLSWKLWFPGFTEFPRAPAIDFLADPILITLQYVAALSLVAGLVSLCVSEQLRRSAILIAAAFAMLFVANQHCLQPWAWQGFIMAVLLATLPIREAKIWIVRITISIYLYSAIGKFDYQFIHSLGQDFLNVVLSWFGAADSVSDQLNSRLVLLLPIGELLIGIGLLFSRTRRLAAWLAIVLHVLLIAILSPVGLNHQWPVIVWNAMSILLVGWLFLPRNDRKRFVGVTSHKASQKMFSWIGIVFAIIVLAGPLLRPLQLWDHWLAWGLYSPSNSRIEVFVVDSARDRCTPESAKYFFESKDQYGSSECRMDRWSLGELGVPIYPQARVQKKAAIRWLQAENLIDQATVIEYSPSHPVTGVRSRTPIQLPKQ